MNEFHQIKASAGSGKTYTLTSRFLELLAGASGTSWSKPPSGCSVPEADGRYGWQEIMAITFTNKAAAEMRERVLARLKDHALAPSSGQKKAGGWKGSRAKDAVDLLIRSRSSLNIRTIDSLLHLMVRLSALDFDLTPDFEPRFDEKEISGPVFDAMAEQARDDEGLALLFRQACRQMLQAEQAKGFLAGDAIRDKVLTLVKLMLEAQTWGAADLASPEEAEQHLRDIVADVMGNAAALRDRLTEEGLKPTAHMAKAMAGCIDCGGSASRLPKSAMLAKEDLDECLLKASRGKASAESRALYASLCADANEARILAKARRLMPFTELARAVLDRLADYERRAGIIAASQVPGLAALAADDSEGVNELLCRFGSRITHILIDEFQDTSRAQWDALLPLASEALSRGGSLTVVGDVKQAIYGWRGGDSALFDEILASPSPLLDICPTPKTTPLEHNWRSRRDIVEWNNGLFRPLGDPTFARALLEGAVDGDADLLEAQAALLCRAFSGAEQKTDHCREGGLVRLFHLPKGQEDEILAERVPQMVADMGRRRPWGDICILVRNNDQAALAAGWLMERRIPVVTQGSLLLASQPVVAGLVSLLRFLNTPDDDIAFSDLLSRSELLPPLPLADGSPLDAARIETWCATRHQRRSMYRQFAADFPEAWEAVFAALHDDAGLLTPYDTIMEVLAHWRVMERCPSASGFVRRFLEVLFSAEDRGISDLSGFLEYWDANGMLEKAPLPESMDAVSIITMHKAKGLEYKAVILPWLNFKQGRATDGDAIFWNSRGTGVLAPLCKEMGAPWQEDRLASLREDLHLVYVAMTRAVSELHCFLPSPETGPVPAMLDALAADLRGRCGDRLREEDGVEIWGEPEDLPPILRPGKPESDEGQEGTDAGQEAEAPAPADELCADDFADEEDFLLWKAGRAEAAPAPDAPENADDPAAGDAGEEAEAGGEGERWRPMGWLPRLRMFRSQLDDWGFSAKRRGTLIHHCLESLQVSGIGGASARRDAELAAARGISTFPLPVPDKEKTQAEAADILTWYASQPDTPHWLAFGTPEHALLDSDGRQYRVDLLVDDGRALTAVEYKTGTPGELPDPAHVAQLQRYLRLLGEASPLPVSGVLVYLDRRELFTIASGEER